ncbi:MAG TPA: DNA repair protein RecN [Acidimicrobiia bacterium]|jgi:DNA repair protein RecN (Recombination protein N)|nr:DNA repair protein RecN [Acidimicrobiia bacterium]
MLDELRVANLALIAEAHLEPGPGLIALTGETGAGKTLLLGALRLLRGDPARSDRIGPAGDEARIDGRFILDDAEVTVARRVAEGRSRAYLDGAMCPARLLGERLAPVVEIVAQHEHIGLTREATVRSIVDGGLDHEGAEAAATYRAAYGAHRELTADLAALGGDRRALERELDLARHQSAEIAGAGFGPGDDEVLATRLGRLRNAEEIAAGLAETHRLLADGDGSDETLGSAVEALRSAARHDPSLTGVLEALEAAAAAVGDVALDVRRAAEELDHDPGALQDLERQAALLGDLRRKYGADLDEVLAYGREAAARADSLERLLENAETLEAEIDRAAAAVAAAAERLSAARRRAAKGLEEAAAAHLRDLGFRNPVVRFSFRSRESSASGADAIDLLFASDAGLEPGPVGRVASGGELSRMVLAIRLAAGGAEAPVLAFDEIDAGIGGATALAMGQKLADLALGRQVFVVTHLPQVAAFADAHYVVERHDAVATVRMVAGDERIGELTRMLGGLPESDRGRGHAAELIAVAAEHRSSVG